MYLFRGRAAATIVEIHQNFFDALNDGVEFMSLFFLVIDRRTASFKLAFFLSVKTSWIAYHENVATAALRPTSNSSCLRSLFALCTCGVTVLVLHSASLYMICP